MLFQGKEAHADTYLVLTDFAHDRKDVQTWVCRDVVAETEVWAVSAWTGQPSCRFGAC